MTDEKSEKKKKNNLGTRTDKKPSGKAHSSLHSARGHSYTLMGTLLEDEYKHFAQQESIKKEGKTINKIVLGKGSFGTVRLAQDEASGLFLVVKKIKPSKAKAKLTPEDLDKLEIEQEIHEAIQQHQIKGTLSAIDIIRTVSSKNEETIYQIFPLASRGDGSNFIEKIAFNSGSKNKELVPHLLLILAKTFADLHEHHIYHRDLKPENILITSQYEVTVADFGSAVIYGEQGKVQAYPNGDVMHNPPEFVKRSPTDTTYTPIPVSYTEEDRIRLVDSWKLGFALAPFIHPDIYEITKKLLPLPLMDSIPHATRLQEYRNFHCELSDKLDELGYSDEVKEALLGLLNLDYTNRLTPIEVLTLLCSQDLAQNLEAVISNSAKQLSQLLAEAFAYAEMTNETPKPSSSSASSSLFSPSPPPQKPIRSKTGADGYEIFYTDDELSDLEPDPDKSEPSSGAQP
ncbi:MAG: protein kinase family protein [Legionella sp.]|uniref:protein kinase family protein n=1 Tax=Legionella sp. TaxID=459 RepID=UPI002845EE76|nr:protein kinase family protein [Legionella sp.]